MSVIDDETTNNPTDDVPVEPKFKLADYLATDREWKSLEKTARRRLWKLAALSVGLTTKKDLPAHSCEADLDAKIQELDARRELFVENLTERAGTSGLQYVPSLSGKNVTQDVNREIDVGIFAQFCTAKDLELPERFPNRASAMVNPSMVVNPSDDNSYMLYVGLLCQYIQQLAVDGAVPPKKLLKGDKVLNCAALADALTTQNLLGKRQSNADGSNSYGLAVGTLRRKLKIGLNKASQTHFGSDSSIEDPEHP